MKHSVLHAVLEARAQRRPLVLVTGLDCGRQWAVIQGEPRSGLDADVGEAARAALLRDRSEVVEVAGGRYFLHAMNPPLRLFVVGAVHIAQALVPWRRSWATR